ncbi:hypothetical protein AGMMS50262_23800 [Bacteroidia bacterium]|nr:hypothetical protein AGMMS50262_23800 [Bacteroidia bacterium]
MPEQQNTEYNKLLKQNNHFIIFKTEDAQISVDVRFESETACEGKTQTKEVG